MFLHVSVCPQGGGIPGQVHPPEQCMLGDTGNKRALRIPLECILVLSFLAHMTFSKRIIAYAIMAIQLQVVCLFFE